MEMRGNNSRSDDGDYDFCSDPKRKNYKKIKLEIKKAMIKDFNEDGVGISTLTKKYHLSYSTIAHILKVYKEKNRIFQPKRMKSQREQESSNSKQGGKSRTQPRELRTEGEGLGLGSFFNLFFPQWAYFMY